MTIFDVRRLVRHLSCSLVNDREPSGGPSKTLLLANRWVVIAPEGHIHSVRVHFYTGEGSLEEMISFLQDRAVSDWQVAHVFDPPEIRFDPQAEDPSLWPPPRPVFADHPRFLNDPEQITADAMTRLIVNLPTIRFVEQDEAPLCYTSVMQLAGEDELEFMKPGDPRFPRVIRKARVTRAW